MHELIAIIAVSILIAALLPPVRTRVVRALGVSSRGERKLQGRPDLKMRLRERFPAFERQAAREAGSLPEIWEGFKALCGDVGLFSVYWKTAGFAPEDDRKAILVQEDAAAYLRDRRKGLKTVQTSAPVEDIGFLYVRYTFPSRLAAISRESFEELQQLTETAAAGLRRLRQEGRWRAGLLHSRPREEAPEAEGRADAPPPAGGHNTHLDRAWRLLVDLARERKLAGVRWRSHGLQPIDRREEIWESRGTAVYKHSAPISPVSFVEIQFLYDGRSGSKPPSRVRESIRTIADSTTSELLKLAPLAPVRSTVEASRSRA